MSKVFYSYDDLKKLTGTILDKMKLANYVPEIIIVPLRGGLFLTQEILYFDEELGKDIKIIPVDVKSYQGETQGMIQIIDSDIFETILEDFTIINGDMNKILIVDDLFDSGNTINYLKTYIDNMESIDKGDLDIKIATLMTKDTNAVDFYGKDISEESFWIVFPWDKN